MNLETKIHLRVSWQDYGILVGHFLSTRAASLGSMNSKMTRFNKIRSILRLQSGPLSISEIHDGLCKRLGIEISRKTVERDLVEMLEAQIVTITHGVPSRFSLNSPTQIELVLTVEEVKSILELTSTRVELYQKIKSILEANGFRV